MARAEKTDNFIASVSPQSYKCTHVPCTTVSGGVTSFVWDDLCLGSLGKPFFHSDQIPL